MGFSHSTRISKLLERLCRSQESFGSLLKVNLIMRESIETNNKISTLVLNLSYIFKKGGSTFGHGDNAEFP